MCQKWKSKKVVKGVVLYSSSDAMTPCYGNSAEVRRTYSTVQYERWEEDIMEVSGLRTTSLNDHDDRAL